MKRSLILLLGLALLLAAIYLFRFRTTDNPSIGRVTFQYILGRPYSMSVDRDRNGKAETILYLGPGDLDLPGRSAEYFEDWDGDGKFDLRGRMVKGEMIWIEIIDNSRNHHEFLFGKQSQDFMVLHPGRFL